MPVSKKRKKKVEKKPYRRVEIHESDVKYICTECCGIEEIPMSVVRTFDEMDQSSINEPPQFYCELCGGLMKPEKYTSVYRKTFKYRKGSELKLRV